MLFRFSREFGRKEWIFQPSELKLLFQTKKARNMVKKPFFFTSEWFAFPLPHFQKSMEQSNAWLTWFLHVIYVSEQKPKLQLVLIKKLFLPSIFSCSLVVTVHSILTIKLLKLQEKASKWLWDLSSSSINTQKKGRPIFSHLGLMLGKPLYNSFKPRIYVPNLFFGTDHRERGLYRWDY